MIKAYLFYMVILFTFQFKPFAFKNVNKAFIEVNNLSSSSGSKQDILENQNSTITIR